MAFTHHGHEIPGSPNFGPKPMWQVVCGGPDECAQCRSDVTVFTVQKYLPRDNASELLTLFPLMYAIITAWEHPGSDPISFHESKQRQLFVDWPMLARAIETLVAQAPRRKQTV